MTAAVPAARVASSRFGRGMVRGALVTVGVRMLDLPSRYGFHLLVAAALGVDQAGRFYVVFSTMVALAGFGRLGIDRALTRQVAAALATGVDEVIRPTIMRAFGAVAVASLAMAALLASGAVLLTGKSDLAGLLVLGALAIIPQNLGAVAAGALAGLNRVGLSQMIYSWLWPALFCGVALCFGTALTAALILIAACFTVTALVGLILLWWALRQVGGAGASPRPPAAPLLRLGLSLFTLELLQLLIAAAPTLILGMVAASDAVGRFALAWRIALVTNVVVSAVTGMAVPKFAACDARGDRHDLARAATHAVGLGVGLGLVPVLAMLALPVPLLGLFGHGYATGAATLRILALGQLIAACFTAMPELLGMTGHTAILRRINMASALVLLAATLLLAPAWGSAGAATATVLAILVNGGGAAWAAHRSLGIAPLRDLARWLRPGWMRPSTMPATPPPQHHAIGNEDK
ncbi:MAG: polysaccharide biosynthesis C-terminal domain-containing protein [Azospirillaceae bacterium]|nr:polysaccharide biosynthesis C-terminal domain-containing protein [Azospirillaceae bacterium]